MERCIGDESFKDTGLFYTLKLIRRKEYEQLPPKVEYSLTERGKSLIPLLDGLCQWGEEHKKNL